jgi:N4-gp56 family major capsid protein
MGNAFTDTTAFTLQIEKALDAQVRWALRAMPIFRPLIDFRPGVLTNPGQPVKLLIEPYIALQKTALPETSDPDTVALGAPTVVNVSPTERGASVVTTLRLEDLAYTDVAMQRARVVGVNMIDTVDDLVKDVYDTGTNVATLENGTEVYTSNDEDLIDPDDHLTGDFIAHNVATMRTRLAMPKEADGTYACVVHPNVSVDIQREAISNASFAYVHANGGDLQAIYNGEVGKWLGARFIESPKVEKVTNSHATTVAEVYTSYMLGREALVEHVVREPHIVLGNFGRDSFKRFFHVGWYGNLGHALYRPEPLQLIKTSATLQ